MAPLLAAPVPFPIQTTPGLGQWELHREPVGVVAGFNAYNFPLFLAVWKAAPAMLAGNTVVLKPSPLTPFGLNALAEACLEDRLPPGVLNIVHGDRMAGEALVAHRGVDLVTFTGSTAVGKSVMAAAAGTAKEVMLELGGKSPASCYPTPTAELAVRGHLVQQHDAVRFRRAWPPPGCWCRQPATTSSARCSRCAPASCCSVRPTIR